MYTAKIAPIDYSTKGKPLTFENLVKESLKIFTRADISKLIGEYVGSGVSAKVFWLGEKAVVKVFKKDTS